jgi:hypothetical protein
MNPKFQVKVLRLAVLIATVAIATFCARAQSSNAPWSLSMVYPADGEVFMAPANIPLEADATYPNLAYTIQYFANSNLIATVAYGAGINLSFEGWTNVAAGSYELIAVATESGGGMETSPPVSITVTEGTAAPPPPPPPSQSFGVSIASPTNGQVFTAPADISLEDLVINTSPTSIEAIQFFANSYDGAVSNSSSSSFLVAALTNGAGTNLSFATWTGVAAGSYELVAVASESGGGMATSPPVSITVTEGTAAPPPPPSLGISIGYPYDGQVFTAPASIEIEAQATVSNTLLIVEFFANSNLVATVTNNPGGNEFVAIWTNVPVGAYSLTAVVSSSNDITAMSPSVVISVNEASSNAPPPPATNPPPVGPLLGISIGYPYDGQVFTAPASIEIEAQATVSNTLLIAEFFANSNLVATVTNNPGGNEFVAIWTNVPVGAYSLTAVVTDSDGATATSPPVPVSVDEASSNAPPPPPATNSPPPSPPVTIASPTNGQVFTAPANIQLEDLVPVISPTSVAIVQIFANLELIARVTNGAGTNLSFEAWTNVAAGSYLLTAVDTETGGSVSTSAPVSITVSEASTNSQETNAVSSSPLTVLGVYSSDTEPVTGSNYVTGGCVYLSIPVTDGMAYCLQRSSDLLNWSPVWTNTAVNGAAKYVAPNLPASSQFYRIVPAKSAK